MKKVEYTYAILRYRHDPVAGEMLNFGVLAYSPTLRLMDWRLDKSTTRFFHAFKGFDREHRRTLSAFNTTAEFLRSNYEHGQFNLFDTDDIKWTASNILGHVWPDRGVRYHFGSEGNGAAPIENSPDPVAVFRRVVDSLYRKFVLDQRRGKPERESRTDEDVWTAFRSRLESSQVASKLQPATIKAAGFNFKFDHTFKNGKLHVVQPLSFDLLDSDSIRDKGMKWYGYCHALADAKELGKLVLLLGGPSARDRLKAYSGAIELLRDMNQSPVLIRESELDGVASRLDKLLVSRGS